MRRQRAYDGSVLTGAVHTGVRSPRLWVALRRPFSPYPGRMFWLTRNRFVGSYFRFSATSFS